MFVYLHGERQAAGRHTLFVAPAQDGAEGAEFRTPEGRPITFSILFEDGRASVPEPLARYLVARGIAHAARMNALSPRLILPRS